MPDPAGSDAPGARGAASGASSPDELFARLAAVADRLDRAAGAADAAAGGRLTDPDPDSGERWEAADVWAHVAEFPGYWLGQVRRVLERALPEPVPFGRVKSDPGRLEAIEHGRRERIADLHDRSRNGLREVEAVLRSYGEDEWTAHGTHPTVGEMDVRTIVERFIVAHLEEHADQLEGLAGRPASTVDPG